MSGPAPGYSLSSSFQHLLNEFCTEFLLLGLFDTFLINCKYSLYPSTVSSLVSSPPPGSLNSLVKTIKMPGSGFTGQRETCWGQSQAIDQDLTGRTGRALGVSKISQGGLDWSGGLRGNFAAF